MRVGLSIWRKMGAVVLAGVIGATGLAGCAQVNSSGGNTFPTKQIRLMAPAAPGGGWDQTSRAIQEALRGQINKPVEVYNVSGAGGMVGLAQFVGHRGDPHELMTTGLIMAGAVVTNKSPVQLDQVTPLARLTTDYQAVVVPANSPLRSMQDVAQAMKRDLPAVAIAGGSAGGVEQILAGMLAKEAGAQPSKINYIAHSGGGEALTTILSGRATIGLSGVSEIADQVEAGRVRALAVSSPNRLPNFNAPTLRETGLDVELSNWRGIVAPAEIKDTDKAALQKMLTTMSRSASWRETLQRRGWGDAFLTGEEFDRFFRDEQARVRGVLNELGMG
jgi:putative tricarboxylic transport membrane protein